MKCVWMVAGVVDYKLCDRLYDCENCPLDQAIHGDPAWRSEVARSRTAAAAPAWDLFNVQGFRVSASLFYFPNHVWVRVEARGRVRLGLDDFAQRLLGRIYAVTLPPAGARVGPRARACAVVHRVGRTVLGSPVTGLVLEVNERLLQEPSLVNRDPYGQGGIMLIEPKFLTRCLRRARYGEPVERWYRSDADLLEAELRRTCAASWAGVGPALADGGMPAEDLTSVISPAELRRLIDSFLCGRRGTLSGGTGGESLPGGDP